MKIINCTPHPITLRDKEYKSQSVARVNTTTKTISKINDIEILETVFKNVVGLPDPKENTIYVVSSIVLNHVKDLRTDIYAPTDFQRDSEGKIIGANALTR